ncbi:MAG: site-specific integrase, partial [Microgenomates group bacterium]
MTEKWYNLYNLEPQFKNFLIAENISSLSLKNYLSDFRHFIGWLIFKLKVKNQKLKVDDDPLKLLAFVTSDLINEYKNYLAENKIPLKTINRRLSTIRKFFSFCISQGWLKENPAKKISNIKNQTSNIDNEQKNTKTDEALKSRIKISNIKYQISNIFSRFLKIDKPKNKQIESNLNFPSLQYYIGVLIVLIFVATLGAGIYNQFFSKSTKTFAYPVSPTKAGRLLSFQGRLTDTLGNPITTATNVTFKLYNVSTGGTALYDTGACSITPDQDGIFNVLIGGSGYSPTPPQQVCGTEIPNSIFTENTNVYLGITVGSDSEMTPRQQIANVGYAINAETLQGLPPGSSPSNIPFINKDGNLLIAASTPGIRSTFTSADFTLSSAKAAIIQSAGAGDVILQATESGTLKLRTGGNSDTFNRVIIDNNGLVGIGLTPSQKLEVSGNIYANGGQIRLGNFASAPTAIGAGSLYYDTTTNKVYYYNGSAWTEVGAGTGGSSWWAQNLGLLYPVNSTLDLAIGGTASSSAKFAFTNINSGTPTFLMNQASNFDLVNSTVNALNIENGLMSFDTQNSQVGIGTTTPGAKLDVSGDIFASGKVKADYLTDYTNENYGIDPAGTTNFGGYSLKVTGGALLAVDSGNVGIGTTAPGNKLEVVGSTTIRNQLTIAPTTGSPGYGPTTLSVDSTDFNTKLNGTMAGGSDYWRIQGTGTADAGVLKIFTGDNGDEPIVFSQFSGATEYERMRIANTGNVGIGTTGPQQKLTLGSGSNFGVEMAVPTGVTATAVSGGTLTAGTYYYKVTAVGGGGETIGSSQVSCTVDGTTTNACQIAWTAPTGASSFKVYGRISPQNQYWTASASPFTDTGAAGTAGSVPSVTTAMVNKLTASGNSWILGGNIGIGTTAPGTKLEVSGNIYANAGQIRLGNFASAPTSIGAGSLYYDTTTNKVYYYNGSAWLEISSGYNWWAQNLGLLYPVNSTLDLAIGGTASSSAKFAFTNINSGTPTFLMN